MVFIVVTIAGLLVVSVGAEILIRGAKRGAAQLGLTPLVIGLTVVAFGTSAPEVTLSLLAVLDGQNSLAVGNVVGSNIFNILFIIGASALVTPLIVAQNLVRQDVPILIAASLAVIGMSADGAIGRVDGALLFVALLGYVAFTIRQSRRESAVVRAEYEAHLSAHASEEERDGRAPPLWWNGVLLVIGLVLLTVGARILVLGAVGLARELGLSELIIGLTVLAVGTSVPEIATSLVAAYRGERDIAVGNAIGSSIFNLLFVLGATGLVAPSEVSVDRAVVYFDLPIMTAAAVACLPIFFTGYCIQRAEGFLLLAYYCAYLAYLILDATGHDATSAVGSVMLTFVLPLTAVTLAILAFRARGQRVHR